MIPHNITKRSFKRYLVKAGLSREVRFHDLRQSLFHNVKLAGRRVRYGRAWTCILCSTPAI